MAAPRRGSPPCSASLWPAVLSSLGRNLTLGVASARSARWRCSATAATSSTWLTCRSIRGRPTVNGPLLAEIVIRSRASLTLSSSSALAPARGQLAPSRRPLARRRGGRAGGLRDPGYSHSARRVEAGRRVPPSREGAKDAARSEAIRGPPRPLCSRASKNTRAEAALIAVADMAKEPAMAERGNLPPSQGRRRRYVRARRSRVGRRVRSLRGWPRRRSARFDRGTNAVTAAGAGKSSCQRPNLSCQEYSGARRRATEGSRFLFVLSAALAPALHPPSLHPRVQLNEGSKLRSRHPPQRPLPASRRARSLRGGRRARSLPRAGQLLPRS